MMEYNTALFEWVNERDSTTLSSNHNVKQGVSHSLLQTQNVYLIITPMPFASPSQT